MHHIPPQLYKSLLLSSIMASPYPVLMTNEQKELQCLDALKRDPGSVVHHTRLSSFYQDIGLKHQAKAHREEIKRLEREVPEPKAASKIEELERLVANAIEHGKYRTARIGCLAILCQQGDNVKAHTIYGFLAEQLGDIGKAKESYLKAALRQPQTPSDEIVIGIARERLDELY